MFYSKEDRIASETRYLFLCQKIGELSGHLELLSRRINEHSERLNRHLMEMTDILREICTERKPRRLRKKTKE